MLPVYVLQLFVAGASAAALTIQVQSPFNAVFGDGTWKHHHDWPRPHPDPERTTIYKTITADGRFSCLTKAIHFVGDAIVHVLDDPDHHITFFAVPDGALHWPHHGGDHDHDDELVNTYRGDYGQLLSTALTDSPYEDFSLMSLFGTPTPDLSTIISSIDDSETSDYVVGKYGDHYDDEKDDDDDDDDHDHDDDKKKERKKKAIQFIINAVLQYHVLPFPTEVEGLRENNTYPTHLALAVALGNKNQRLRVENRYKKHKVDTYLNHFTKVVVPDVQASNGFIHVVNHPIIPPASAFQELFAMERRFSTFTSALQRTDLLDEVDLRYIWDKEKDEGHFEGSAAVTVFAIPEHAWHRLPKRLRMFLFSPFGTGALRKLLEYHIAPGVVVHSDYFHNQTAETTPEFNQRACTCSESGILKKKKKHHHPHREPISSVDLTLDTRFFNHSLHWVAKKNELTYPGHGRHRRQPEYETQVFVNGQEVEIPDIIALNGAIHVIDRIMCPWQHEDKEGGRHHRHPHHRHHHRGGHHHDDDDDDHHHHHGRHRHHGGMYDHSGDGDGDRVWQGWEEHFAQLIEVF